MKRWRMLIVPLMAALGAMFLRAHMLVPGLALLALAAMLPQIRFTSAHYQQMCRQIEGGQSQRDPELQQFAEPQRPVEGQSAAPLRSA